MPPRRKKTHYQILGVSPDVTTSDIKRAYRKLVKSHHPDLGHHKQSKTEIDKATEEMRILNEAYETLMDKARRARYDTSIGLHRHGTKFVFDTVSEDQAREKFLAKAFHPVRRSLGKILLAYKKQLRELSQDIYDDEYIAAFEKYVDHLEQVLRDSSNLLASEVCPTTLETATRMLRYAIAHAADALEEMRNFCKNFDYQHLILAESLTRIALDLSRQSIRLIRA